MNAFLLRNFRKCTRELPNTFACSFVILIVVALGKQSIAFQSCIIIFTKSFWQSLTSPWLGLLLRLVIGLLTSVELPIFLVHMLSSYNAFCNSTISANPIDTLFEITMMSHKLVAFKR